MDLANFTDNLCRICLKDNAFFDWTEAIFEFFGPSYKECYFKYTHLQEEDEDFSTYMICLDCGDGLRKTYELVEKALASYKKLKALKTNEPTERYTIERVTFTDMNDILMENSEEENSLPDSIISNSHLEEELINSNSLQSIEDSQSMNETDCNENLTLSSKIPKLDSGGQTGKKRKRLSLLCFYCSKICNTKEALTNHEMTHDKNRERTEVCPICGLKFYSKQALRFHVPIHDENRKRKYKCEFCPKAFFGLGGLNVHRRIHLGQMVKCKLCSKEFYRQVDLNRHVRFHDAAPLTMDNHKEPKPLWTAKLVAVKSIGIAGKLTKQSI